MFKFRIKFEPLFSSLLLWQLLQMVGIYSSGKSYCIKSAWLNLTYEFSC